MMTWVKMSRDGRYGIKGAIIQVTEAEGKRMVENKAATACEDPRRGKRTKVSNKALSATG